MVVVSGGGALPLKQFEVVLLNAEKVLARFLEQPLEPHLVFEATIRRLARQAARLVERSAATCAQRAWRRHRAQRAHLTAQPPARACKAQKIAPSPTKQTSPATAVASQCSDSASQKMRPLPMQQSQPVTPVSGLARPPVVSAPCSSPRPHLGSLNDKESTSRPHPLRPPASSAPSKEVGVALNPIEKRRQMVVSQLAAANPGRLARNRRLMLEKATPRDVPASSAGYAAAAGSSQPPHAAAAACAAGLSPQAPLEATECDVNAAGVPTPRSRPGSCTRRPVNSATATAFSRTAAPRSEPLDPEDSRIVPERSTESWPSSPVRAAAAHRRLPPADAAPMPGCSGRGPPADLLLKEMQDDDPLELIRSAGAGLSMAPPTPTSNRPLSAGRTSLRPEYGGYHCAGMESKPATASTTAPLCGTPEGFFSPPGSLNSSLVG